MRDPFPLHTLWTSANALAELLITSYFAVVKREMIDMVPKAITLTLVNHAKENLQRELLESLYKPDVLEELLKESPDVVARYVFPVAEQCWSILTTETDDASVSRWSARSTRPRLSSLPSRRSRRNTYMPDLTRGGGR